MIDIIEEIRNNGKIHYICNENHDCLFLSIKYIKYYEYKKGK